MTEPNVIDGFAALMRQALAGADLSALGKELLAREEASGDVGALIDLSTLLQIRGTPDVARSVQMLAVSRQQLYRVRSNAASASVRVLVPVVAGDLSANLPIECLIEDSDIVVYLLYMAPSLPVPPLLPEHDVVLIGVGEADAHKPALAHIARVFEHWHRPVLNRPERIVRLSRDSSSRLLAGVRGLVSATTARVSRAQVEAIARAELSIGSLLASSDFPIIIRPIDSHAGKGLCKLERASELAGYLAEQAAAEFFVARFIDYRSGDGLFRKFRIVLVDGKPFAGHIAMSEHWMIHYVNAGMTTHPERRAEEAQFMATFDVGFASKHATALRALFERTQLDYLVIDCAETKDGELLVFEIDTSAVIHALDPVDMFAYKQVPMRRIFAAFRALLLSAAERPAFRSTQDWLPEGGDERIALDPLSGANRYGSTPFPDDAQIALGSSTSSTISREGFEAAQRVQERLSRSAGDARAPGLATSYGEQLERVRHELAELCQVADLPGLQIAFGASGTDLHLIAAQIVAARSPKPLLVLVVAKSETGAGVALAMAGRNFGTTAAIGGAVVKGDAIPDAAANELIAVQTRHADARLRASADIDAEFTRLARQAIRAGKRVLLTLVDVSKTGLIAPSLACAMAIRAEAPDTVDVLVDACQLRLSRASLRCHLERGFMVAITGSKFMAGPSFAGALLVPSSMSAGLQAGSARRGLRLYCARADWPVVLGAGDELCEATNIGLLLRWEAALTQMRAFCALPDVFIASSLRAFSHAVTERLRREQLFLPLEVPPLDRTALHAGTYWDNCQTIFPFMLRHPQTGLPLSLSQAARVWQLLESELDSHSLGLTTPVAETRFQLGQAIGCGEHAGIELGALRICASARVVVAAKERDGTDVAPALAALEKTAAIVRHLRFL